MNRQVRRAEEKKERKQEREKEKAKAARRARRRERVAARSRSRAADDGDTGGDAGSDAGGGAGADRAAGRTGRRGSDPGRFSGALMIATVFFMVLQGVAPSDGTVASQVVSAAFYMLFGYFAVLWLMRRRSASPIALALGIGAVLWLGTGLSQWLQPQLDPAPWTLLLALPLLVAGAFLGRLVFRNAPR